MKIVIAPDSFKGSLSAGEICDIVERSAKEVFPCCEIIKIPMADGGEGTVESLSQTLQAHSVTCTVQDPLGRDIVAEYRMADQNAIMEMAAASGLTLVTESERDILLQSTYGTGQMVRHALENGCKHIYIGIGGSATNDGGMGFAAALGVQFLGESGHVLEPVPLNFEKIHHVDLSNLHPMAVKTPITVMCDVTNPLLGDMGATKVFGKQKGADERTAPLLEQGLTHYISAVERATERDVRNIPGAGAAGGLGAGLLAFTNAKLQSGVQTILDILDVGKKISGASFVITGEGRMDSQSAFGKVASGVGLLCKEAQIPCFALVGSMGDNAMAMYEYGITSIIPTVNAVMGLEEALRHAPSLCSEASLRMLRIVKAGMELCV